MTILITLVLFLSLSARPSEGGELQPVLKSPLIEPQMGEFWGRWDLVVKTCDVEGAGTDAQVFLKVYYENSDQQTLQLDSVRDDFERGQRDHFPLVLDRDDVWKIGMYWWPSGTVREPFCVEWVISLLSLEWYYLAWTDVFKVVLLNSEREVCYIAVFEDWIGFFYDPPTFPKYFRDSDYTKCISIPISWLLIIVSTVINSKA